MINGGVEVARWVSMVAVEIIPSQIAAVVAHNDTIYVQIRILRTLVNKPGLSIGITLNTNVSRSV